MELKTADELMEDTEKGYLTMILGLSQNDVKGLIASDKKYGDSWKRRGGVGAFMMLARKWDRLENLMKKQAFPYDIFWALAQDQRKEGIVDDIRDLRRYLLLVEAEMSSRGFSREASDLQDSDEPEFTGFVGEKVASYQEVLNEAEWANKHK